METKLQSAFKEVDQAIIVINEVKEGTSLEMRFLHGETYTDIAFLVTKEPRTDSLQPIYRFIRNRLV